MTRNPLVPIKAAAARMAALKVTTEAGLALTIIDGEVRAKGHAPAPIHEIHRVDQVTTAPGALSRGTGAGVGAAIGLLFSPMGAAIGAAAGAALAKGKTHFRLSIIAGNGQHFIIQIAESKARLLELAARRPIT